MTDWLRWIDGDIAPRLFSNITRLEAVLANIDEGTLTRSERARYERLLTAAAIARVVADRLDVIDIADDGEMGSPPSEATIRWFLANAATARIWRDAWFILLGQHFERLADRSLRYKEWGDGENDEQFVTILAELATTDFYERAIDELELMADYLEHLVPTSRCPDHAAWLENHRSWVRTFRQVIAHQKATGEEGKAGTWGEFCFSPAYMEACASHISLELAVTTVMSIGGLAEFWAAEARAATTADFVSGGDDGS